MPNEPNFPSTGLVGSLQLLYEGLLLRDILGYAFPGATVIAGVMLLTLDQNPFEGADPGTLIVLILASYICGVFLRLLGTTLRVLVNSAEFVGWLGDPWEVTAEPAKQRCPVNRLWRGKDDSRVLDIYRAQLRGDESGKKLSDLTRRESLFLHIAGNFALASLLLWALILVLLLIHCPRWNPTPFDWIAVPYAGRLPLWTAVGGLPLLSFVLIVGHYVHARAFKMLLRAAKS